MRSKSDKRDPVRAKAYYAWRDMIRRCTDPKHKSFHNYGGRGIRVCDRWLTSFDDFLADMGRPDEGLSIDRIENDGDYKPGNCRWADIYTQRANTREREQCMFEHEGKSLTLLGWAEIVGINDTTIRSRLKSGWSFAEAISKKPHPRNRRFA